MSNEKFEERQCAPLRVGSSALLAPDWQGIGAEVVYPQVVFVNDPSFIDAGHDASPAHLLNLDIEIVPKAGFVLSQEGMAAMVEASGNMLRRIEEEGYQPEFV